MTPRRTLRAAQHYCFPLCVQHYCVPEARDRIVRFAVLDLQICTWILYGQTISQRCVQKVRHPWIGRFAFATERSISDATCSPVCSCAVPRTCLPHFYHLRWIGLGPQILPFFIAICPFFAVNVRPNEIHLRSFAAYLVDAQCPRQRQRSLFHASRLSSTEAPHAAARRLLVPRTFHTRG